MTEQAKQGSSRPVLTSAEPQRLVADIAEIRSATSDAAI